MEGKDLKEDEGGRDSGGDDSYIVCSPCWFTCLTLRMLACCVCGGGECVRLLVIVSLWIFGCKLASCICLVDLLAPKL